MLFLARAEHADASGSVQLLFSLFRATPSDDLMSSSLIVVGVFVNITSSILSSLPYAK